jgi:hypothetical protein
MSDSTIISWTPANWITVVLMVAITFAALGAVTRIVQQRKANA